jgi:hypothetical protein
VQYRSARWAQLATPTIGNRSALRDGRTASWLSHYVNPNGGRDSHGRPCSDRALLSQGGDELRQRSAAVTAAGAGRSGAKNAPDVSRVEHDATKLLVSASACGRRSAGAARIFQQLQKLLTQVPVVLVLAHRAAN